MIIDLRDHWAEIERLAREWHVLMGNIVPNKALAPRHASLVDAQIDGMAGEYAVSLALHGSVVPARNRHLDAIAQARARVAGGDGGVDGSIGKLTYEVKTTRLPTGRLLLPANVQSRAAVLILAVGATGDRTYPPCLRLAGWIPRSFFDRLSTLDERLPRPAPALDQRHLFDMSVLIKMMEGFR